MADLIQQNLTKMQQDIYVAERQYGRATDSVRLLAVSKDQSVAAMRSAYAAGQHCFGENYLQEALQKMQELSDLSLEWHFIGHIQSNKTAQLAQRFDWVQTVCDLKIAERLNRQRPATLPPLNICIQVNISGEASKDGLDPSAVITFAKALQKFSYLRLRGLMAIPAATVDFSAQRISFHKLKQLFDELNQMGMELDTLSMGMSNDFNAAIAEGSTLLRIGTLIFGARS